MIAVSNKFTKFVVQNSASHTGKHTTYLAANKAGSLSDNLTPVRLHCSAKQPRGLASFVYNRNFFPKMQNSEKVSGTVNNSTRTARAHSAQFSQRIYNVLSGGSCKVFFAEIENVCIFVVRQNRSHSVKTDTYCTSYTALSLSRFRFGDCGSVARKGGNAFFFAQARNYQP